MSTFELVLSRRTKMRLVYGSNVWTACKSFYLAFGAQLSDKNNVQTKARYMTPILNQGKAYAT